MSEYECSACATTFDDAEDPPYDIPDGDGNVLCPRCWEGSELGRIDELEAEITRLRAELAKAQAVAEPLQTLLSIAHGHPLTIRQQASDHYRIDLHGCEYEAAGLGEALKLAAMNVK